MLIVLYILIGAALLTVPLRRLTPYGSLAAPLGMLAALVMHLYTEGLTGGGPAGSAVVWPSYLSWLGEPHYRADNLSATMGAWCLVLGTLLLLGAAARSQESGTSATSSGIEAALVTVLVAVIYSLAHTFNLLAYAGQMLLLVALAWGLFSVDGSAESGIGQGHSPLALGFGAVFTLGGTLIIGRTTGGLYSLIDMSLSALTGWTLTLLLVGFMFWLGVSPFTGWSARLGGRHAAAIQALVVLPPALTLILRLQALVSAQGLAGSLPSGWAAFTTLLAWGGAATAIAAGAGTIVYAGTTRWQAALTAHAAGLVLWGLGLDNPAGRYAAVAVAATYGASRVVAELASVSASNQALAWGAGSQAKLAAWARGIAAAAASGLPLTAGFLGVWLLGSALLQTRHAAPTLALAGGVVLALFGAGLHIAASLQPAEKQPVEETTFLSGLTVWLGLAGAALLLLGGATPGLWLREAARAAQIAGGNIEPGTVWTGFQTQDGQGVPFLLLGLSVMLFVVVGLLIRRWAGATMGYASILLPAALARLENKPSGESPSMLPAPPTQAPSPAWWLSLVWLEDGVWGFGLLLLRLGTRLGLGLGRLEGRYYLPLVLVLALIALLAITR